MDSVPGEENQIESVADLGQQYGFITKKPQHWLNKQRTLIVSSRGVNARHRHLMIDLYNLLPHSKKESKLEKKEIAAQLNDLCLANSCNNLLYFESRKRQDLYLWMARSPNGPTIKFLVENIHTSEELKLTGNCIKGSRPLLSFDSTFEESAHWKLMKELISQTFGTPQHHPKSKPFYDHILSFYVLDNRIWFRNYQIFREPEGKSAESFDLVEIGPRFVLNPIKIFEGCITGMVLYNNQNFVSPNQVRKVKKDQKLKTQLSRLNKKRNRKQADLAIKDEIEDFYEENLE